MQQGVTRTLKRILQKVISLDIIIMIGLMGKYKITCRCLKTSVTISFDVIFYKMVADIFALIQECY